MRTSHELNNCLWNFKTCAQEAPDGTYEQAKAIHQIIADAVDAIRSGLRANGLQASGSDPAFWLEAAIYDYMRESNPGNSMFTVAEAFGSHLSGPERQRVLDQAVRNRDALRLVGAATGRAGTMGAASG